MLYTKRQILQRRNSNELTWMQTFEVEPWDNLINKYDQISSKYIISDTFKQSPDYIK